MYVGTQIRFQTDYVVRPKTEGLTNNQMLRNKKATNGKWEIEKLRIEELLDMEDVWNWFGSFTRLV